MEVTSQKTLERYTQMGYIANPRVSFILASPANLPPPKKQTQIHTHTLSYTHTHKHTHSLSLSPVSTRGLVPWFGPHLPLLPHSCLSFSTSVWLRHLHPKILPPPMYTNTLTHNHPFIPSSPLAAPFSWASLVAQLVKNPPTMRETWVRSLGWKDPLEKGKATYSRILAWRVPWGV